MAPKHTTGGPRAHYPGINKVAPAHAIGGSHRSEYSGVKSLVGMPPLYGTHPSQVAWRNSREVK